MEMVFDFIKGNSRGTFEPISNDDIPETESQCQSWNEKSIIKEHSKIQGNHYCCRPRLVTLFVVLTILNALIMSITLYATIQRKAASDLLTYKNVLEFTSFNCKISHVYSLPSSFCCNSNNLNLKGLAMIGAC
jgi:hypothetical protein